MIDLRFGENTTPFKKVVESLQEELKNINLYPDSNRELLTEAIAKHESIQREGIYISNGVDGAIEAVLKAMYTPDAELLMPAPSFMGYAYASKNIGIQVSYFYLNDNFSINLELILSKVNKNTRFIVIVNPNNPTGNILLSNEEIELLLNKFSGYVLVDETYYNFSKISCKNLLDRHEKLVIFRSFSKGYGLAGLRIGTIFGHKSLIQKIKNTEGKSNKFIVNSLALKAAELVMDNFTEALAYLDTFNKEKSNFEERLKLKNIAIIPSCTSFVLIKLPIKSKILQKQLSVHNILIKSTEDFINFPDDIAIIGVPRHNEQEFIVQSIHDILYEYE